MKMQPYTGVVQAQDREGEVQEERWGNAALF